MFLDMTDSYGIYGVARPGSVPFPVAIGTLSNQWLWVPAVGLLGTYLLLLFPDGRLPSRRWSPLAWLSGAVIVLLSVTGDSPPDRWRTKEGYATRSGLRNFLGWRMQR
jgi:hypothetical protein